jgi:hypothetical protein
MTLKRRHDVGEFFSGIWRNERFILVDYINQNKKAVDLCKSTKTTACETLSHRPMIFLKSTELPRTMTSYASHWKTKMINNLINPKYGFQH